MATLRRPHPAPAAAVPLPPDVRATNAAAAALAAVLALGLAAAAVQWLMHAPWLPIRSIELEGGLVRSSVPTIRANATPHLAGNFVGIDLQASRAAFERVPWVRRAEVRRVWPDRLVVRLEEHRAVALWTSDGGAERLLNDHGEVFDANVGDVEDEGLPLVEAPDESRAGEVARVLAALAPLAARLDDEIAALVLSDRGSWRLQLVGGAAIELGRGSEAEVLARAERFAASVRTATARWQAPLEYADLRHDDGYAIRLRGVVTGRAATN